MTDRLARDTLAGQIAMELEISSQFIRHVDPIDEDYIALIRSAGRHAGRMLGWKVRTFQTDPERRADGKVVVIVAVVETTPQDEARFRAQGEALVNDVLKNWPFLGRAEPSSEI